MGNARARRKAHAVTRLKSPEISVDPDIRRPFDDVDELFFIRFRMRPGKAAAGWQRLMVDAECIRGLHYASTS